MKTPVVPVYGERGTSFARTALMSNAKTSSVVLQSSESIPTSRTTDAPVPAADKQQETLDRKPLDAEGLDPYDNVACTD